MAKHKIQFNWGTIIALLVSFAALITTIYEANILKSQQQAMVWPYFEVGPTYNGEGFGFRAKNSGTGPAIITSVEVLHNGEPIGSFMELLRDVSPKDSVVNLYNYNYQSLNNTVFPPGEERMVFFMKWSPLNRMLEQRVGEIDIKVEYKSVLDDYWTYTLSTGEHVQERFQSSKEFFTSD